MKDTKEGFVPNPILAGLVGVCPMVAASRSLAEGLAYGLGTAFCALGLGALVPVLKAKLPDRLRAPATLCLSAALALCYALVLRLYSPTIAEGLGIYLPLLAVSGLSLSVIRRGSSKGRYKPDGHSRLVDVSLESALFLLTSAAFGGIRELVGLGTLCLPTGGLVPSTVDLLGYAPLRFLVSPAGGFILLGLFVAAYRWIVRISRRRSE